MRPSKFLPRNDKKFQHIFESLPDVYFETMLDGTVIELSPAITQILQYTPEELIGSTLFNISFDPQGGDIFLKNIEKSGRLLDYEVRLLDKGGKIVTCSLSSQWVLDKKGIPYKLCGTLRDITHRKQVEEELETAKEFAEHLYKVIPSAIFTVDKEKKISSWNKAAEKITGFKESEVVGKGCSTFAESPCAQNCGLYSDSSIKPVLARECIIVTKSGERRIISKNADYLRNLNGEIIGGIESFEDITERKASEEQLKKSLAEKELLLKEVHHRVKNNLIVISNLLKFQAERFDNAEVLQIFQEARNRIRTMMLIYEKLYRSEDLRNINLGNYIEDLVEELFETYNIYPGRIQLHYDLQAVSIAIKKAIPCGLILNELLSNAFKHAFPDHRSGAIWISLRELPPRLVDNGQEFGFRRKNNFSQVELIVRDDGIGIVPEINISRCSSMGLQIVSLMVQQLRGRLEVNSKSGTEFKVYFSGL